MIRARLATPTALVLALVAVLGGCAGSTKRAATPAPGTSSATASVSATVPTVTPSERPTVTSAVPPSAPPSTPFSSKSRLAIYVIHIRKFAYVPVAPVVAVGQPIEIINDDAAAHTWSAAPKSNWTYTSGNLDKGQHVIFGGFTAPGRYPFLCYYHAEMPSMNGIITVNPA
jgi:plastocyanin